MDRHTVPPRRGWRYRGEDKRDLRLDLLRGFAVFAMVVDHIGGASWLYAIAGGTASSSPPPKASSPSPG